MKGDQTRNNRSQIKNNERHFIIMIISTFSIVIILFTLFFWITYIVPSKTPPTLSDRAGTVGAVFSALAFGGVILALYLQRKELSYQRRELRLNRRELTLQREELEHTRAEIERTASAQEKSERSLSAQATAMLTASRLNAANALAQSYNELENNSNNDSVSRRIGGMHSVKYRQLIEIILAEMQSSHPGRIGEGSSDTRFGRDYLRLLAKVTESSWSELKKNPTTWDANNKIPFVHFLNELRTFKEQAGVLGTPYEHVIDGYLKRLQPLHDRPFEAVDAGIQSVFKLINDS